MLYVSCYQLAYQKLFATIPSRLDILSKCVVYVWLHLYHVPGCVCVLVSVPFLDDSAPPPPLTRFLVLIAHFHHVLL